MLFEVQFADELASFDGGVSVGIASFWLDLAQLFYYFCVGGSEETQGIVFVLLLWEGGPYLVLFVLVGEKELHFKNYN